MGSSDVAAKIAAAMLGLPDADPEIQRRLNMWVVGDPNRGINWAMIGGHLRGRLDAQAYELIGYQIHVIDNRARVGRGEAEDPEPSAAEQAIGGTAALNAVRDDIRAALDDLPNFVGRSYRISGIANAGVYSGQIKEGDLIKDTTFWSTSLVRGSSGAAGAWGADGTAEKPKAYFIIDGATGKYIAKYSQVKGEQEVLFKDNTVFKVNRVVNDKSSSTTFFVYISQVTAATGALQIKNPYDGTVQP
jgi:hypothetical protein